MGNGFVRRLELRPFGGGGGRYGMSGKKAISFRDRAYAKEIAVCGLVSIIMRGVTVTVDR